MRIVRLAQLLEYKYNLGVVTATSKEDEQKINDVRQEILDAFNNYFNPKTVKPAYNIIPLLAEQGEKYSRQITALMEDLVNDVDSLDLYNLFQGIQNILAVINNLQEGEKKDLRNSIDNAFPLQRETDRNRRTMAKSKFENVVFKKLASILFKLSKKLNIMLGKAMPLVGGPTEPEVKEPTKQEQFMFRQSPLAVAHHLDNPEVFSKLWLMPELRRRLIRVMNRGKNRYATMHTDPEIMAETQAIMDDFNRRKTNEEYFEAPEHEAKQMTSALPPEEEWARQMQEAKNQKSEEPASSMSPEQLNKAIEDRDREHDQREQKKQEEALINKYNERNFERWLRS